MTRTLLAIAAAGLMAPFAIGGAAMADPGDQWREQFKIRAECDKKLAEADSRRKFHKELYECRKKLAEWRGKQREEAFKAWEEREKQWHDRWDD